MMNRIKAFGPACLGALIAAALPAAAAQPPVPSYHVIYDFSAPGDGTQPVGSLVQDSEGRLYGATASGGASNQGTVFRLTRPATGHGMWTEEILHSFDISDGQNPIGALLLGPSGEVYGTTLYGGSDGYGTIFRLDNAPGWPLTTLHDFTFKLEASLPAGSIVFGPGGLIYGTTTLSRVPPHFGVIYSVSPAGDTVEYAILHRFHSNIDGYYPIGLINGPNGALDGAVIQGGPFGGGSTFELVQNAAGEWAEHIIYQPQQASLFFTFGLALGHDHEIYACNIGGAQGSNGGVVQLTPPASHSGQFSNTPIYEFGAGTITKVCFITIGPRAR